MALLSLPAADGTALSVRVTGRSEGPAVLLCDGIGCDGYIWRYLRPFLEKSFKVVHFHYRGHGSSAQPEDTGTYTIEQCAGDGWAVLDALGIDAAVLMGHSMGVQVALDAARQNPARVRGLVALCGAFERPLDTFAGSDLAVRALPYVTKWGFRSPDRLRRLWAAAMVPEFAYKFATATELNVRMIRRDDFLPYLAHMGRMDPIVFLRYLESVAAHSARPNLASIPCPVLVIAGARDGFTPPRLAEELARQVPRGELCIVPGGSHAAPLELPDLIELRIEGFLAALA
ncbi:MAG: alpha/beta hydrolase [Myxococcales bacterium]|nr:alpha/beta hydrolase [Myxococcales bacterium]